ncbi:cilia- and flagella-associated protein 77-like [Anneissia japonica]|uniref:cilia- and flagella-associated protein 77-like n=1 Tax=Anneissia japonica TaxID=1529436 RepID=UPI0014255A1A|nr:cilia- and flagella-associated protein 77-like [Anneissia japonica]
MSVGVFDPDMLYDNPLLQKSQLGKPLKRGFTLPSEDFTFGRPNQTKDGGASEAITGWTKLAAIPLGKGRNEKKQERDFVALNKACVSAGLITAQEHFQYRATHDVRRRVSEEEKNKTKIRRIPPTAVYGVPTRPSTPVFDLLEHKYQDRWLQERRKTELAKRERDQEKETAQKGIYETRASLLRKYCPPVDGEPLWHMPRFRKTSPHLETFRSPEAKSKSFKHHASDCTARTGVFGHGIYESAKS